MGVGRGRWRNRPEGTSQAGDEYEDDDVTDGLRTHNPWYLLAPGDEGRSEEEPTRACAEAILDGEGNSV
jgi:hypothetical protein